VAEAMRVSCPRCGLVHEDVEALQATVTKQAKEIVALKRALNEQRRTGPHMDEINEVFDYWKVKLGKRSDVVLGKQRIDAVRARLREGFTVERLKRAIDGCATDDWAMGRVKRSGGKSFNDLGKHICNSEASVETFEELVDKPRSDNVVELRPKGQATHDPLRRPLDRAILALRREFGVDAVDGRFPEPGRPNRAPEWWSVCPVNPGLGQPMRIRERAGRSSSLELDCVHGCLPSQLLDAIKALEDRQEQAQVPMRARARLSPGAR
jgi:hypothetical protein